MAGLAVVLLALILWQAQRYAAFDWAQGNDPLTPQEASPPAYFAASRADPPRTVTFFGASNYARSPILEPLAEALSACAGTPVRVRAVAKAGANSDWGMAHLEEALDDGGILVIGFAGNDASLWRGMPLARSIANHRAMVAAAKDQGLMVFLSGGGGASGIHGLSRLVRPGLPAYAQATGARLARESGTARVPANAAFARLTEGERRALMPDGLHSTPEAVLRYTLPQHLEMLRPLVCP